MSTAIQTVLQNISQSRIVPGVQTSLTIGTATLSNNYSFGSSGTAFGFTFESPEGGNLTDIWVVPSSFGLNWAGTDQVINWEVRDGIQGNYIPGTTLTGSGTIALNSATDSGNWVHVGSLSLALTAGKMYYFIITDADGPASAGVVMNQSIRTGGISCLSVAASTSNGWSTAASASYPSPVVLKIGGRLMGGSIISSSANLSSNTVERGNELTVAEPTTLVGMSYTSNAGAVLYNTTGWSVYIYDGSTNPGGTKLKTVTLANSTRGSATANVPSVYVFNPADHFSLLPGRTYRVVVKPSANAIVPQKLGTFGNPDASIKSLFGGGDITLKSIIESSGTWTTDDTAIIDLGMVLTTRPGPTVIS